VLPTFFDEHHHHNGEIDLNPVDGIMALLDAVNQAARKNMGVGGYFNIILFDGQAAPDKIITEINDHRSHLASEVMTALRSGYIKRSVAARIIEGMLFLDKDTTWAENLLFKGLSNDDLRKLHRFLRGYKEEK